MTEPHSTPFSVPLARELTTFKGQAGLEQALTWRLNEACDEIESLEEQFEVENKRADAWADLASWMWTIICNVSEGDWTKQSEVWQDAAADCREQYHALLKANPAAAPSEEPIPASDPDGAYWRAQGGVPNQESKP